MNRGGGVGHYGMDVSPLRQAMTAHIASGTIPGAVTALVRGDEVAVDAIGGHTHPGSGPAVPMARDTVFRVASLTKPMIATAVLSLVQDGVLGLDDPVGDLLPELAARRVLTAPDGPLSDTVPAEREITVRDLLTFTWGFGDDPSMPHDSPVRRAAEELQMSIGTLLPPVPHEPDEWMRRLGTLPLLRQPGESWIYDVGSDVLAVLLARAAGTDVGTVLQERAFGPFGMVDTGFHATSEQVRRMPPLYSGTDVIDPPDGCWSRPPSFPSGAGGLVSTADDLIAYTGALLRGDGLDPALHTAMTTDQIEPRHRGSFYLGDRGWGFGLSVYGDADKTIGWAGGSGTYWFSDLSRGTTALMLTQTMFGEASGALIGDFERTALEVLDRR